MKVEIYSTPPATQGTIKIMLKELNLEVVPDAGDYFLDETTKQCYEIIHKIVSEVKVILIVGVMEVGAKSLDSFLGVEE
jgi:hypothetical protein